MILGGWNPFKSIVSPFKAIGKLVTGQPIDAFKTIVGALPDNLKLAAIIAAPFTGGASMAAMPFIDPLTGALGINQGGGESPIAWQTPGGGTPGGGPNWEKIFKPDSVGTTLLKYGIPALGTVAGSLLSARGQEKAAEKAAQIQREAAREAAMLQALGPTRGGTSRAGNLGFFAMPGATNLRLRPEEYALIAREMFPKSRPVPTA